MAVRDARQHIAVPDTRGGRPFPASNEGTRAMFEMPAAERWRLTLPLISALVAVAIFAAIFASTLAALRGPHLLDYHVASTAHAGWWRVTWVWPSSAAWDAGLRDGTLLYGPRRPATQ